MDDELTGYCDPMCVAPGESLRVMVSCSDATFAATLVRLLHADENAAGPGCREEPVASAANRRHAGGLQPVFPGSCVLVADGGRAMAEPARFSLVMWVWPTMQGDGRERGLLTGWDAAAGHGFGMFFGAAGDLAFAASDGQGGRSTVATGVPMRLRSWHLVAACVDGPAGRVRLWQQPTGGADGAEAVSVSRTLRLAMPPGKAAALLIGAAALVPGRVPPAPQGVFNGKIARPCVFSECLSAGQLVALAGGQAPAAIGATLGAAWDFAEGHAGAHVRDRGPRALHGRTLNMPVRAVTGPGWTGAVLDHRFRPAEYDAMHFHDDDIEDCGWRPSLSVEVPAGARSGFYALRLQAGDRHDHVPFFVRPSAAAAPAPICFLAPTMTYLAYANDRMESLARHRAGITDREVSAGPLDLALAARPEFGLSLYDHHRDGSRCIHSSWLRPILSMRPNYRYWLTGAPRHLSADLYMIDWLEAKGFAHDVITDHDLHHEGPGLLGRYRVAITGSHPEYWTAPMMAAMAAFQSAGGRLMYLGGNGFYWVTAVCPERPHAIEVRRGLAGALPLESAPGEGHLAATGEPGGLWRGRGRAPNRIAGVGFGAQGWAGRAPGYRRRPASFDPRAAFIFEGIGADEVIGDFGLVLGGAAGDELDRADTLLGTPPEALVLASSQGHDRAVMPVIEDAAEISADLFAGDHPDVRADMVWYELPGGGAVFSVGSICWFGSLSHNGYDNNVSRITENVLRRFMA